MNPDEITLKNINKLFEYELSSREIDSCSDVELLRNICKSYIKLYLLQQEILIDMEDDFLDLNN